jgi:hypothetical protein
MWSATRPLARVVMLGGHRRDQSMEPCLSGQFRMERGRDHVPLADRNDPSVIEPGQDIDLVARPLDDRSADEHRMDRSVADDRNGHVRLE